MPARRVCDGAFWYLLLLADQGFRRQFELKSATPTARVRALALVIALMRLALYALWPSMLNLDICCSRRHRALRSHALMDELGDRRLVPGSVVLDNGSQGSSVSFLPFHNRLLTKSASLLQIFI